MTKKDILELKKRFTKNGCTFTKMCGCYVNGNKQQVVKLRETFLNLDEDEFYKYMDIAKKTLSGNVGNNLLELNFPGAEEESGGRHQFLMGLKGSLLKNDELLERFYEQVIENYDYAGNYLILLFHDAYDVPVKTKDNKRLDESEEVYEYIICAVCPVTLSKPGLGYIEEENRIGARIRDWVVNPPETGFIFPAFTERSTDIHSVMYYTKDPAETHPEFVENILGCMPKRTAAEQKAVFQTIVKKAIRKEEEESEAILLEIQQNLKELIEPEDEESEADAEPVIATAETIKSVIAESHIPEEAAAIIGQAYVEEFGEEPPAAEYLIDAKALAANAQKVRERELVKEVHTLKRKLQEKDDTKGSSFAEDREQEPYEVADTDASGLTATSAEGMGQSAVDGDIVLTVSPEKASRIKAQFIDGVRCLIIPMEDDEEAVINGQNASLDID